MMATTTNGWTVLEAVATTVAAALAVVAALVAAFYGRKANVGATGAAHLQPDGHVVLAVEVSISAPGVRPVRISAKGDHVPTITVTEVLSDGPEGDPLRHGAAWEDADGFEDEELVGAGETVSRVVLFHQPVPTPELVGWSVTFLVDGPKFPTWARGWWTWTADAFVEVPRGVQKTLQDP
jgi:hypothetical protein